MDDVTSCKLFWGHRGQKKKNDLLLRPVRVLTKTPTLESTSTQKMLFHCFLFLNPPLVYIFKVVLQLVGSLEHLINSATALHTVFFIHTVSVCCG